MRGALGTTLSLPRRWSRKEQEHQVPLVILGASIAHVLSLFSQPVCPQVILYIPARCGK